MANVIPPRALVEIQARVQRVVSEQRAALLCLAALLCGKTMPCWCVCNVAHSGHARARAGYSGRSSCPEHLRASIRRCAPRQDHQAVAVGCGCGLWLWRAVLAHVNAAVMGAAFDQVRFDFIARCQPTREGTWFMRMRVYRKDERCTACTVVDEGVVAMRVCMNGCMYECTYVRTYVCMYV